jgi:peptide/nickel transport system substrate-binding protein
VVAFASALVFGAVVSGCGPASGPRGEALEVLLPAPPVNLDPRFSTDAASMRLTRLAHAGLTRLSERRLEPEPYAAKSYEFQGDRELSITLRDDIRFASGAPFESADVCATLRAFADPNVGSPHRVVASSIGSCLEEGPHAVRLKLSEGRASLLADLEVPILRRDEAFGPPRPDGSLDGLGPYRITEATGSTTRLVARAGGTLPRPAFDVVARVVRDENARVVRLMADRADVVPNGLSPVVLSALVDRGGLIRTSPGANLTYLLLQNQRAPFDRHDARLAMAHAIDRPLLARTSLGGRARVARSLLPPESWAAPAETDDATLSFDPAEAKRLFATLPTRHVSLLTSTDRARVALCRAIAQMAGDVGLEVEVVPLDLGVLLARLSSGDFEAALLQIPELTEPNVLRWFFHSESIPGQGPGGANRARFANAEADKYLDEAAVDPARDHRTKAYASFLQLVNREVPVVPLFHEDQVAAVSPRAGSFSLSAEGRWLGLATVPRTGPPLLRICKAPFQFWITNVATRPLAPGPRAP